MTHTKTSLTGLALAGAFMSLIAGPSALAQNRFYLSSDKVFAPGTDAKVKLESRGLKTLQFRLYRIDDPKAYFDAQRDLHRPKEDVAPARATSWSLMKQAVEIGVSEQVDEMRGAIDRRVGRQLRSIFPAVKKAAQRGSNGGHVEKVVPVLRDYELMDIWQHPLSERSGWSYDQIPIPTSEPGVYLVEAVGGGQTAHTIVLISHVAIVAKQSSTKLLVWAVDPATGEPRPGTDVLVQVRGQQKGKETTDSTGLARFDLGLTSSAVIYAEIDKSFTLLDPRFFPANLPNPRVYVYTERPVYRPGQTVYIKGFARDIADEKFVIPQPSEAQLEIVDPRGQVYKTITAPVSDRGSFDGEVVLPAEPTHGTWTVFANVDGNRHAGEFKILAFVKPEVKLRVRLDKKAVRSGDKLSGDIVGAYFYGAPYPNAEVKITVSRTRFYIPWYVDADYSWYYSEAEYQNTRRETVLETTCTLDAKGECGFEAMTMQGSEDFSYIVEAVAQDPKGKTVIGVGRASVTLGAFHLSIEQPSIVAEPGETQTIRVRAQGYDSSPVTTNIDILVRARHVAEDGVQETIEILSKTVPTDDTGVAQFELSPDRAGYYEIIVKAKDDKNNLIEEEGFIFIAEEGSPVPMVPSDMQLVTDKKSYFAGDTATILVLTPTPIAQVLFTVEGGDLYRAEVLQAKGHAALVRVKIGERQTPNFFISATSVTAGQVFTRQRSVIVPPRDKLLKVEVAPDKPIVEPGDEVGFSVIVTDHAGNPVPDAEVVVGIVDEAIYSVSPEITVPIESFFYHRKRNDVRSNNSLSFRFFGSSRTPGAKHAGRSHTNPFAFGSLKPQEDDRTVFKDTAAWYPTLITGADGRVTAKVTLPDNLAAWRITARVMSKSTAVASGTGKIIAKKPVIVQVAFPKGLHEGDTGQGTIMVHNLTGKDQSFELGLSFEAQAGATAKVDFKPETPLSAVTVANGANKRIAFSYTTSGTGELKLIARAEAGIHKDGLQRTLELTSWSRMARLFRAGGTDADTQTMSYELKLGPSTTPAEATMQVNLLPSSLSAVRASLPYLMAFPYGCTEQTMSRFMPVLAAKKAMASMSMEMGNLEQELPKAVEAGLARLSTLQHNDGGWGWWAEDNSDLWMTTWVLEGLAEAKSLGTEVDQEQIDRGVKYLEKRLARGKTTGLRRAQALLALARHGKAKPEMLNAAIEADKGHDEMSVLLLAAHASERPELVKSLQDTLIKEARTDADDTIWCEMNRSTMAGEDPTECTAMALLALAKTGATGRVLRSAERYLMAQFDGISFGTTRQTAIAIRALCELHDKVPTKEATFIVSVNGTKVSETTVASGTLEAVTLNPKLSLTKHSAIVSIQQNGGGSYFHSISLSSPDRSPKFAAQGPIKVKRKYYNLRGASGDYTIGTPSYLFETGEAVLVALEVSSPRALDHFMLEDFRPAGLTPIQRDGGLKVKRIRLKPKGVHREHRADRTAFFKRRLRKGRTTFYYMARAALPGRYQALPAHAESMYLPNRDQGDSASSQLEVTARR